MMTMIRLKSSEIMKKWNWNMPSIGPAWALAATGGWKIVRSTT